MSQILNAMEPATRDEAIRRGAELIAGGGIVAFPTETVYGLGADATNESAVRKIFEAKGRPSTNPIIVHVDSWQSARDLVTDWNAAAELLSARFPEGPLTMVLRAGPRIAPAVLAGGSTVGVRVPTNKIARELIRSSARPIAAPSANRSNALSPTTAAAVAASLGDLVSLILDGGPCEVGIESTVIDLTTAVAVILRPGVITAEDLTAVLGHPVGLAGEDRSSEILKSPGMFPRHYAPATPLEVIEDSALPPRSQDYYLIGFSDDEANARFDKALPLHSGKAAAALFESLRVADLSGRKKIFVANPPSGPEWTAIRDRLRRAAV